MNGISKDQNFPVIAAVLHPARFGAAGTPLALACSEWMMTWLGWVLVRQATAPAKT